MWYSFLAQKCAFSHLPPIAQPVEQLPFKEKVAGSIPAGRTYDKSHTKVWLLSYVLPSEQYVLLASRDRSCSEIILESLTNRNILNGY